jgi:sarcosine oxidase subunit beta
VTQPKAFDVVIIGGGISGTAAAYELARAGLSVALVEKGALASMASGWTLAGVRQSGRHPAELPLARAAVARWADLSRELGADVEYRREGNLRLARTPEEVPVIAALVTDQRAAGLDLTFLSTAAEVREVAPALAPDVLAASFCPTDGHANPTATVLAFATAAARHGASVTTNQAVIGITAAGGRVTAVHTTAGPISTDHVVIAAGVYSDHLCRLVGLDLPLSVSHVTAVQTVPLPPLIRQVLGVANADFAGRQEASGRFRMTGGATPWPLAPGDISADAIQPPGEGVMTTLQRGIRLLPALGASPVARVWGGLIDMTPDALPVIERVPEIDGLIVAAGFSGHGFCLGPVTGRIIREIVTTGSSSLPIDPFRRNRFAAREPVPAATTLHG